MEKFNDPSFWLNLALILVIGFALMILILKALKILATRTKVAPMAFRPFVVVVRWAGILIILAFVLEEFGIDMMETVLAALGLVAIGIVAVWSLLSHITATFLLVLLKPFNIGDTIEIPGEEVRGMLVDINLFFALLRDESGNEYIIPNNQFFQKTTRRKMGEGRIELQDQLDQPRPYEPGKVNH